MSLKTVLFSTLLGVTGLAACEHGSTPDPFGVPISGGTMLVSNDGNRAVVADADRDRIVTIDLATGKVVRDLPLNPGDEPGRIAEDAAGRMHVALRKGGSLVTVDANGELLARRFACNEPRGVAYDPASDRVHVACATGELVTFDAAGSPAPVRKLTIERDLRDVIVQGANLIVTKFRTAEFLTLDDRGQIVSRVLPPTVQRSDFGLGGLGDAPPDPNNPNPGVVNAQASTAYRTIAMPDGRIVMTHQRQTRASLDAEQPGGYGGGCGKGPVEDGVTMMATGGALSSVHRIGRGALPVDIAATKTGDKLAMVVAGSRRVVVVPAAALDQPDQDECQPDPPPDDCNTQPPTDPTTGTGDFGGAPDMGCPCKDDNFDGRCDDDDQGEDEKRLGTPTSVAFAPNGDLLIWYPEASAVILRASGGPVSRRIQLSGDIAYDPGRSVFHTQTVLGLACASCHPEGRDDGQTWNFAQFGARRTQSLAGHIAQRAPYHWTGDESSLPVLMEDVFSSRMSGGILTENQKAALGPWLDRIPAPSPVAVDQTAADRGKLVFESAGCASCHNGAVLTNNTLVNVGTGGKFKVPSLLGIGARAPFMHDGCAATLKDRFVTCGGGDAHGITSNLSTTQIDDLVVYLNSL